MHFSNITLFPDMFAALDYGICGRAQKRGLISIDYYNPRDFSDNKHHTVDDRPYGGGPGMVMLYQPLKQAILKAKQHQPDAPVIYLTPQGTPLQQTHVQALSQEPHLLLLSGRYEGVDQRLLDTWVDLEFSIGDYVLSGGELAAMVLIDAITRLLPGALGDEESAAQDSFNHHLLDYPHFTRPEIIDNQTVPPVLLSGDHQAIARWRKMQALGRTFERRPDLLAKRPLTNDEETLLNKYLLERGLRKES